MQRKDLTCPGLSGLILAVLGGVALAVSAHAQGWPEKPVRVLIPFTAGSATDTIARTVFEQVGRQIGQPAIIESRPGAGGYHCLRRRRTSPFPHPDGHTVLFTSYRPTPSRRCSGGRALRRGAGPRRRHDRR